MAQLGELEREHDTLAQAGLALYGVSAEPPADQVELEKRLKLRVSLLSDPRGALLDALGVRDERGPPWIDRVFYGARPGDIAKPSTLLIDREGRIRLLYRSASVDDRPPLRALLAAQQRMQLAETTSMTNDV